MFIFETNYTFEWPVKVKLPTAGGEEIREFTAVFRMPEDELELYQPPEEDVTLAAMIEADRAKLAMHWVGWTGIQTSDGDDLSFSSEMRARLLKQSPIRKAVALAFTEATLGIREKN
jgi:hypothetical protein